MDRPLRIAGATDDARAAWRHADAVARENRAAALRTDLDPTDPRWVIAVRTQAQLEGGVLSPERRARVLRTAKQLGVAPFDANVIVAIVQDRARRGQPLADAAGMIAMVPRRTGRSARSAIIRMAVAVVCAVVGAVLLIRWLS